MVVAFMRLANIRWASGGSARRADHSGSSFIGCPYVHARLDLPDDDHPAAPVVAAHNDGMLRELAALLTEIGVRDPEHRAEVVLMLLDGAVSTR
jgi:hypothetical protein